MARRLYLPTNLPSFTNQQENDIYQRFFMGYNAFKDRNELKELIEAITMYRKRLRTLNIHDYQVRTMEPNCCKMVYNLLISVVRMIFSLIFALPGVLMLFPLGLILQYFAEKER
mmetsp:Transcript_2192/g.2126  ORF Transcript_2192/g.2126 Transcript_2192/m.2126 type:complete len:114 (-) Transcript_2192:594-935(-)